MIKVFRKIRQKLLSENKFSKYLLYAIGEIILVVLGILIALQVNNWNENRKRIAVETETLKEIKAGLISDLDDFRTNRREHHTALVSAEILMGYFKQELAYHDSLGFHINNYWRTAVFISRSGAYETLKVKGMELVTNKNIRRSLNEIYDFDYEYLLKMEETVISAATENERYLLSTVKNYLPNDNLVSAFEYLRKDNGFNYRLAKMSDAQNSTVNRYRHVYNKVFATVQEIETEIQRLEGNTFQSIPVTFYLEGNRNAKNVILTGDFIYWDTENYPMEYNPDKDQWQKTTTLTLIPGKGYLYKFIVDGQWIHDKKNPLTEDDGQGGFNSVLYLTKKNSDYQR